MKRLFTLILLVSAVVGVYYAVSNTRSVAAAGNTFYISPSGSDSANCSSATPCATFSKAYSVMTGGDTLIVKNGTYNQQTVISATIRPPSGSATIGYTVVKAETPGEVVVDGKGTMSPLYLNGAPASPLSYVHIDGIVFRRQASGAQMYQVDHMKFTRDGFEDGGSGNTMTFNLHRYSSYILVEDCYAWGSGRYKFSTYHADHVIFRRNIARQDRHEANGEPLAVFTIYATDSAEVQNNVVIDGDKGSFWINPSEYGGAFSVSSTDGPSTNVNFTGNLDINTDLAFTVLAKNLTNITFSNNVAWHIREGGWLRDWATFKNMTIGDLTGPARSTVNSDGVGMRFEWGDDPTNNNSMTNSILMNIKGPALWQFSSENNNDFYGNNSNRGGGTPTGSGSVTTNPALKYIARSSDSAVPTMGANIIYQTGKSGTLYGEAGYNTLQSQVLWPFPQEANAARYMKDYAYSSLSGNRGFAALSGTHANPLTDYIWSINPNQPWPSFTNPVPTEFAGAVNPNPTTYTITASAGMGGTISPVGVSTVNSGASQIYTITPATNYQIASVVVNGVSVGTPTSYTFSNVTNNQTISATFSSSVQPSTKFMINDRVQTTAVLNVRSTPSSTGTLLGTQALGAIGTVTGGPTVANGLNWWNINYDSGVDGWSTEDYLVKYTAPVATYSITATAGAGGTVTPSGVSVVNSGSSKSYVVTPSNNYTISDVKVNNVSVGSVTSYTFSNVTSNQTISATFSPVVVPPSTFSIGARIQVVSTATVRYGASTVQTVTGTQSAGVQGVITNGPKNVDGYVWWNVNFDNSTIDGWTIQDNLTTTLSSTTPPQTTTYVIVATSGTGGSIVPNATSTVLMGSSQTYTITPTAGYKISDVKVDGASVGAVTTYTFNAVSAPHSITASFAAIQQFNCPCSLLSGTPSTALDPDTGAVELGVQFTPAVDGVIKSVRFYKGGSANKGTHTGKIWSSTGQKLGTVTFTNESSSGWQTATFSTPIPVSANKVYIASYYAPRGRYSSNNNYFTQPKVVGPLSIPVNAGVYKYGGGFPTDAYQASNYWVDVVFTPGSAVAETAHQNWVANVIQSVWSTLRGVFVR